MENDEHSSMIKLVSAEGHEFIVDRKYYLPNLSLATSESCISSLGVLWYLELLKPCSLVRVE